MYFYIGNHDILKFDICVHYAFFVQIIQTIKKLPHDLHYLFFFEQTEFLLESEERVFCKFHQQADVSFIGSHMIQLNKVFMVAE